MKKLMVILPIALFIILLNLASSPGKKGSTNKIIQDSLKVIANDLAIEVPADTIEKWINVVIQQESNMRPNAVNPLSGAFGLIQWTSPALKECGLTKKDIKRASLEQQLHYTRIYFLRTLSHRGPPKNFMDTYLYVFYPAAVGHGDNRKIASKPSKVYRQNPGYHTPSGVITRGSIRRILEKKFPHIREISEYEILRRHYSQGFRDAKNEFQLLTKELGSPDAARMYLKGYTTRARITAGL